MWLFFACVPTVDSAKEDAVELCNGRDDDEDGEIDEGAVDAPPAWPDADQDGWGDEDAPSAACDLPGGYVDRGGDCDDADAAVHPAAGEACDGIDQDCDGEVDEELAAGGWADQDGDGWGGEVALDCTVAVVATGGDCDDADADVHPGATEICDGADQDCDGQTDEDAGEVPAWPDADGDGWGDAAAAGVACALGQGQVQQGGDCDDADPAIHPEAPERCDEADEDCDGEIDEDAGESWAADGDGDGWGAGETRAACAQPEGMGPVGDCDDEDAAVHPEAEERCDEVDNDCDGSVDVDAVDPNVYYLDDDGDGYGDKLTSGCTLPEGAATVAYDCDDLDPAVNPAATEHCDGVDEDCDGSVDEDAGDAPTWHLDVDGDGAGGPWTTTACEAAEGYVPGGEDCDDADPAIRPGAAESCDGVDQDCDGADGQDADGDGHAGCDADCDDGDPAISPDAAEICGSGVDEDCDGGGCNPHGEVEADLVLAGDAEEGLARAGAIADGLFWVASPAWDDDAYDQGRVRVMSLVDGEPVEAAVLLGDEEPTDGFGWAVAAGDFDGDGEPDLAAAARGADAADGSVVDFEGAVQLYAGPFSGERRDPLLTLRGTAAGDQLGEGGVAFVDGALLVGEDDEAWLVRAGSGEVQVEESGGLALSGFSTCLAVDAYDRDGDGIAASVVVAAGAAWILETGALEGSVDVADADVELRGEVVAEAVLPDRDGDGLDELVLAEAGTVWIFADTGPFTVVDLDAADDFLRLGPEFGASLGAVDSDGDGVAELLVGDDEGAWLYEGEDTVASFATGTAPQAAGLGDLDGDGIDELGLTLPGEDGTLWLVFGGAL